MIRSLLFWGLLVVSVSVGAQDLHYSQFYNSPLNVNPGKTGIFNGDKRITLSYKSQWRSVPVPWTTFSGSFDRKFYPKYGQKHFFSAGILLNHDRQGQLAKIDLANINLTGSFTKIINENNLFTFGALLGYATRGFDFESLTWDTQWNGAFDPNLPSGEQFNTERISFLENALGLNYRLQKSKRTKMDIGAAVFHLIDPNISFTDVAQSDVTLGRRLTITGVGSAQLSDKWDIQLNVLSQSQKESKETITSILGKYHLNQKRGKETELHLGFGWRSGKSWFPVIAFQHKDFYIGVNYDVDHTDYNSIHNTRPTSFEAHFRYIITDVKPKVKVCPIF